MSYCYFLVRLKKPLISSLKEFDYDSVDIAFSHGSFQQVREKIIEALPEVIKWGKWENESIQSSDGSIKQLSAQALNSSGRFEVGICCYQGVNYINIDGSHHVDQVDDVKAIAQKLNMSVFDVQTGEIIYFQEEN